MPFTKHIIEPITIAQCPLPPGEPNELECLSNLTLANVIRELSSLGQHAGRLFDELVQDAVKCQARLHALDSRMSALKAKCAALDIQNDEPDQVEHARVKKQFKSSVKLDQQVVARRTMPDSIRMLYENADPPPALDKLNPYRSDGKDCMKFYTDPGFFFNIWCNELMKDNETRKNEKKKRKSRGDKLTPKSAANTNNNNNQYADPSMVQKQLNYPESPRPPPIVGVSCATQQQQYQYHQEQVYAGKAGVVPPLLPPAAPQAAGYYINANEDEEANNGGLPLPPPPPPQLMNQQATSYEVYAESTRLSNGMRSAKMSIQQANKQQQHYAPTGMLLPPNERPHLPPPPVPTSNENHLSDLQQIQQQIIRKFDGMSLASSRNMTDSSSHDHSNEQSAGDLPPPPPPMHLDSTNGGGLYNSHHPKVAFNHHHHLNHHDHDNDNDMPLPPPPPPIDLLHSTTTTTASSLSVSNVQVAAVVTTAAPAPPLPPPPPPSLLPVPLVEPDPTTTSSSSNSSLSATTANNLTSTAAAKSGAPASSSVGRSFLDDINKGRFVLRPTQKESLEDRQKKASSTPSNDDGGAGGGTGGNIQPFVNNSDVAAIIDFVRKYRPHVCESSDDEENSDWDE